MESLLLRSHMLWDHEPGRGTLTPSPSPIRWERVAVRPDAGKRFMESANPHAKGVEQTSPGQRPGKDLRKDPLRPARAQFSLCAGLSIISSNAFHKFRGAAGA